MKREYVQENQNISSDQLGRLESQLDAGGFSGCEQKRIKMEKKTLFITARNESVKAQLRGKYADKGEMEVFCTSSKLYLKGKSTETLLATQVSGIPELRNRCNSIVSRARYAEAEHFLREDKQLLSAIRLWIDGLKSVERMPSSVFERCKTKMELLGANVC
jgi:hypothetical protein